MSDNRPPEFLDPEDYEPPQVIRALHPEVVRWVECISSWPADKPFPLTLLEACYVMWGFTVEPAAESTPEDLL